MTDKYTIDDIKNALLHTFVTGVRYVSEHYPETKSGALTCMLEQLEPKVTDLINQAYRKGLEEGYQIAIEKCLK
jgi:hypothetical protein